MQIEDFVKQFYPKAKAICTKAGIPAVGCLAQAALETGWGESHPDNIWFGIKPWRKEQKKSKQKTTEELDGKPGLEEVKDDFVAFKSFEDACQGYCDFIKGNPRYKEALKYPYFWRTYIAEVAKAGYATDPNYATKVSYCGKQIERLIYTMGLES